jgi:hypothetical protein
LAALAAVAVVTMPLAAQTKDDKAKKEGDAGLTQAQRVELAPLLALVDSVMKGAAAGTYLVPPAGKEGAPQSQAAPADVPLSWKNDFLAAANNLTYVPFTIFVEPGRLGSTSTVTYLRVAPKGSGPAPPTADKPGDKKDQASPYAFEDVYFTDLRSPGPQQPLKLTRAFAVPPGPYDVYVAIRDRSGTSADAPVKAAVLKQELTVPNYQGGDLQTSTIILADKIEPLSAPVPPEAQRERPYALGSAEIVPAADTKFKKTEELGVVFQIYGARLGDDKKPDVTVEYVFHQKDPAGGEKPFNKTTPQTFNAQSLPAHFDPASGHQIVGGQSIPLATFPEGDFRLEIKVTDNKAGKSISRDVLFTVAPSS